MTQTTHDATAAGSAGTTTSDRQRQRAARGIRSRSAAAGADQRPSPPRRRRPALAAVAVLLIVGGAALAGLLALRLDSREYVLVVGQDLAIGQEITPDVLVRSRVAAESTLLVRENQASQVLGTYARIALQEGQLLDTTMLVRTPPAGDDTATVGVPLASANVPPGLRAGDEVRLIRISDGTNPAGALATALVTDTGSTGGGDGLGATAEARLATLLVPADAADAVVDAAATGRLGMALLRRGVAVDEAVLTPLGDAS